MEFQKVHLHHDLHPHPDLDGDAGVGLEDHVGRVLSRVRAQTSFLKHQFNARSVTVINSVADPSHETDLVSKNYAKINTQKKPIIIRISLYFYYSTENIN